MAGGLRNDSGLGALLRFEMTLFDLCSGSENSLKEKEKHIPHMTKGGKSPVDFVVHFMSLFIFSLCVCVLLCAGLSIARQIIRELFNQPIIAWMSFFFMCVW